MDEIPKTEIFLNDINKNPHCPHGPTLIFKRITKDGERSFFACSACRDRKDCNFFHWTDEKITTSKLKAWEREKERAIPKINHCALYKKFVKLGEESSDHRAYCHSCNVLILCSELPKLHKGHDVTVGISDYKLNHPSELLKPLDSAKKEAQYLFTNETTKTIVNMIASLGARKVICLGVPRVHEFICSENSEHMDSLLLDIDHRYHQFNSPERFCWFNSFNNYFFSEKDGLRVLSKFLNDGGENVVLVMDPPFGGRVEPLANTLQEISKLYKSVCPYIQREMTVLWIFPYFMESHILASCPNFSMLDYKVDYDNHPLFASGPKGRKHGSPVRIFTNVDPKAFALPAGEGYRYCKKCERWVSRENLHCTACNSCPSKDGRTYVHCYICKRCVKPSWTHCNTCNRCCLPSHVCGDFLPSQLCFNCGESGHKKRDCKHASSDFHITIKGDSSVRLNTRKKKNMNKKFQINSEETQRERKVKEFSIKGSKVSKKKRKPKSKLKQLKLKAVFSKPIL